MNIQLEKYLCDFMNTRTNVLKEYLLTALERENQGILFTESSEGTPVPPSPDLKNCEFLKDAGLLAEKSRSPRHAPNRYRVFHLTEEGKLLAVKLRHEKSGESGLKMLLTNKA